MAFHLVGPRALTRGELRHLIPAGHLIKMQVEGALTGFFRTYDTNGVESQAAVPLSLQQRLDLTEKLIKKVLPDMKTDDGVEPTAVDPVMIASDPDQVKRLTTTEIRAAIEASFKIPEKAAAD
jgi:hypothetical protein